MKKNTKNALQALAGIGIAGFFLYFTLRDKPMSSIWLQIQESQLVFLLLNGVCLYVTFLLRALRWKVLVENMGYTPRRREVVHALIIGYFVNSFTPKLGEVARCTALSQSSAIPVSKSLGSVVSERIYDVLVLFLGLALFFVVEFQKLWDFFLTFIPDSSSISSGFSVKWLVIVIVGMVLLGGIVFIARKLMPRVRGFIAEMIQGFKDSIRIRKYPLFILLTIAIWSVLVLMNYMCLLALPATANSGIYLAVVILFVGGIGWALPAPGGIGTTHFFILQLFLVFGLSSDAGISFGILSNGLTFIFTLGIGLISVPVWYFRLRKSSATWSGSK